MDMRLLLHKKRIIEPQIAQPAKPPAKKPTAPPSDSEEDSDDEGGLFDDILGGGGHQETESEQEEPEVLEESHAQDAEIKESVKLNLMGKMPLEDSFQVTEEEEGEEFKKFEEIATDLLEMIKKCTLEQLEVCDKQKICKVVELMQEYQTKAKTNDEVADILLRSHWLAEMEEEQSRKPWSTYQICLALHSNDQDAILRQILGQKGEQAIDWDTFTRYSIPLWLKNPLKLADLTNTMANNEFNISNAPEARDVAPDQANHVAIWFIALRKLSKLAKLYQLENNDKLAKFMLSDFSKPKTLKQSERNAYLLKGQKRYTLCAGFFLLAQNSTDAVHVLLRDQRDINLAVLACRLLQGQESKAVQQIFQSQFVNKAPGLKDIWLESIGHWHCKRYVAAVNSLGSATIFKRQEEEEKVLHPDEQQQDQFNLMTESIEKQSELWQYPRPLLSLPNPTLPNLVYKIRQHYLVVNELEGTSSSAGGSIFDAFHGAKEESKKPQVKKPSLKIQLDQFDAITSKDFLNRGLPYFALAGAKSMAGRQLVQLLVRDIHDKSGAQTLKDTVRSLIDTLSKRYPGIEKDQLYSVAVQEFSLQNAPIASYLIRTLYQGRGKILGSLLLDVVQLQQRISWAYPFAGQGERTEAKYMEIMSALEQRLNALMVISSRSGKLISEGFSPQPTPNQDYDIDESPNTHNVPSQFPDMSGSFDRQFLNEQDFIAAQAEQQKRMQSLRQHLYFWLHIVTFELSVSLHCFSSSVGILINLSSMLDSRSFEISHIENLHMNLKQMQASLIIRNQQPLFDAEDLRIMPSIDPYRCMKFIYIFLQDISIRNLINVLTQSFKHSSTIEPRLSEFKGDILFKEIRNAGSLTNQADLLFSRDKLLRSLSHLQRKLAFVKSIFNLKELTFKERAQISKTLVKFFQEDQWTRASSVFDLSLLFKEKTEVRRFSEAFNMKQHLSRLRRSRFRMIHYEGGSVSAVQEAAGLYGNGIQIFRWKGESVAGFSINSCHERNMAIALPHRGSREINIQHTLLFRNRKAEENGLRIMDDEVKTWDQCLRRYDNLVESHRHGDFIPPFPAIVGANDQLYPPNFNLKQVLPLQDQRPVEFFRNKPSILYLKYRRKKASTHDELAYSIADHPNLTVYLTGNGQSEINLWVYESFEDASIDHFYATSSMVQHSKKCPIEKLRFNWYGDKFGALDAQQNFFMFNLDLSPACSYPYFNLDRSEVGHAISDFAFFNQSSILATCAPKPKPIFCLYDLLMPKLEPALKIANHGGDTMQLLPKQQRVVLFNERKGYATFFDLRKPGAPLYQKDVHNDKVSASARHRDRLVTGSDSGVVKVWKIGAELELIEKIDAFQMKPQEVSDIQITRNGALFASSQNGAIKLLRTQI